MLPDLVVSFLVFGFGTLIGSFLNVVILRWNTGALFGHRSRCFSCGRSLSWSELVPLVSFFIQRGRCRSCGSKISWQYPAVEFLTGLIFLLIYFKFGVNLAGLAAGAAAALLIVISFYDLYHKIVPDNLVYGFDFLALIFAFLSSSSFPPYSTLAAGPLLWSFFALLWLLSAGRWMGLGDAKLALGIGWLLGLSAGVSAIIVSFWLGALVGLIWLWRRSFYITMEHEIPFAPFIIIAAGLVFFFELDLFSLLLPKF